MIKLWALTEKIRGKRVVISDTYGCFALYKTKKRAKEEFDTGYWTEGAKDPKIQKIEINIVE